MKEPTAQYCAVGSLIHRHKKRAGMDFLREAANDVWTYCFDRKRSMHFAWNASDQNQIQRDRFRA